VDPRLSSEVAYVPDAGVAFHSVNVASMKLGDKELKVGIATTKLDRTGRVALASGWNKAYFDNFSIECRERQCLQSRPSATPRSELPRRKQQRQRRKLPKAPAQTSTSQSALWS